MSPPSNCYSSLPRINSKLLQGSHVVTSFASLVCLLGVLQTLPICSDLGNIPFAIPFNKNVFLHLFAQLLPSYYIVIRLNITSSERLSLITLFQVATSSTTSLWGRTHAVLYCLIQAQWRPGCFSCWDCYWQTNFSCQPLQELLQPQRDDLPKAMPLPM